MSLGHTLGMVLGAIAAMLAAFLTVDPNPDGAEVNRALAGLSVALMAGSLFLLHNYPAEVTTSPPQPPSS